MPEITLKEAIAEVNLYLDHSDQWSHERLDQALKLGNEAMKWRALMERDYGSWCGPLLPGETEE